jgi:hypothetical protein
MRAQTFPLLVTPLLEMGNNKLLKLGGMLLIVHLLPPRLTEGIQKVVDFELI